MIKSNLNIKGILDGIRPTEILSVSEWAEKYRYLTGEASFTEGLYKCSVTPYAKPIMDALGDYSTYQEIIFCKASQTGGTEIGNNWIGYIMHISPGPTLMLMPTEETAIRNSKIRIDPMIAHCKELKERVGEKKSRDGDNTILQKKFPGGVLYIGCSNSSAGLKSIPVRRIMLDEVDEYPLDLNGQGGADNLAKVRTRFFPNRKIFYVSTPTVEGQSLIYRKFMETDQNYFEVPCPHCGTYQRLVFSQLKWDEGKEKEVKYQCIHCEKMIDEMMKPEMLLQGMFVPADKDKVCPERIGFHVNSLYAPFHIFSWADIVQEFKAALKDNNQMKIFVNTILGEPYSMPSTAPEFMSIYNKREEYPINKVHEDVVFLTAGVDIQKDRIEVEIVGWCANKRSYSIDYRVLIGSPFLPDVWNQLAQLIDSDIDGCKIKMIAIDSGYATSEVYNFTRKYPFTRVIAIKGSDTLNISVAPPKSIDLNIHGQKFGKVKYWTIGVSMLKHELYAWLRLEKENGIPPPYYCHFPQYDETHFRSLTAEDWIPEKRIWKKRFERNERLDCRIYALGAAIIIGLDRMNEAQLNSMKQMRTYIETQRKIVNKGSEYDYVW